MLTKLEEIIMWLLGALCFLPVLVYVGMVAWEHFDDPEYPHSGFCPDSPEHFE